MKYVYLIFTLFFSAFASTTGGEITCSTTWRAASSSRSSSRSSSSTVSSRSSSANTSCQPTGISPMMHDGATGWANVTSVTVPAGTVVFLGPHPYDIETGWSWSGCGLNSTEREVGVTASAPCTATATFTNSCGAVSTKDFQINVTSSSSRASSSRSSAAQTSSASSLFTLIWGAPTKRENNEDLALSEIGGFAIKYENGQVVTLPPSARSHKVSSDKVLIAAFDTNGLYSAYVQPQR